MDSFAAILDPMDVATFERDYLGRKPVLIRGGADKFANVMGWDTLNELLNMSAIWSAKSLLLFLDTEQIPPEQFCVPALDRDQQQTLRPRPDRVLDYLRQGASLVLNDIDTLTDGLRRITTALEAGTHAKVQANLYCSWAEHQGFHSHFDTHDVYAVHLAGEKLWRVYSTCFPDPIAHPKFKSFGRAWHEQNRGDILIEEVLRPGDLLYLPRGQYHDAVAVSPGTFHIAFGVTSVIGLDFLGLLYDLAVEDPLFRATMPRHTDPAAVTARIEQLGARLAELSRDGQLAERFGAFQRGFRFVRGGFDLPEDVVRERYGLAATGLQIQRQGEHWILRSDKGAVEIPAPARDMVAWVIDQGHFDRAAFDGAFGGISDTQRGALLKDLLAMKVIRRV